MEKLKMIELFSGIGAQERAMRQIGIPYEVINTCDCDKDACLSYAAMRNDIEKEMETFKFPSKEQMVMELQEKNLGFDFEHKQKHTITMKTNEEKIKQYYIADKLSKNLGDISKVEKLPYADMVTYSFPCTDLSVAGKGEGMVNKCECGYSWPIDFSNSEESLICPECGRTVKRSTRSGLLGQVQRLLSISYEYNTLPKYLLLENVKNLIGKKFKPQFDAWVKWLDSIGYNTYWKVLNAKQYGIPQNRERIFAVSIRKDIDNKLFKFPEPITLANRLKDILEKNVDEKYYLPDDRIQKILNSTFMQEKKRIQTTDVCDTLLARDWKDPKCVPIEEPFCAASRGRNLENPSDRTAGVPMEQVLEPRFDGVTNTITTVQKDCYVIEPQTLNKNINRIHEGARFGRLTVIRDTGEKQGTNHIWECKCACGNTCYLSTGKIGITTNSCGCYKIESHRTHNMSKTRLYNIWKLMKARCYNSNSQNYNNYGKRGITICDEWKNDFILFYNWAINNGYLENLTIERVDVNGNYCPENCTWADITTQVNNRRNWGQLEYYGLVPDNTGYRTQVTVDGKKIYIAHSTNDIKYLINKRNEYIDEHNLPNKKNILHNKVEIEPRIVEDQFPGSRDARIYPNYSPTLRSNCGGLKVADGEDINPKLVGGIGEKNFGKQYRQGNRVYDSDEIAMALNAQPVGNAGGQSYLYAVEETQLKWRIRKLTPKECWRLMGFSDSDFNKAAKYVSNSCLYKTAGNSICTCCLVAIFNSLLLHDSSGNYKNLLVDYNY